MQEKYLNIILLSGITGQQTECCVQRCWLYHPDYNMLWAGSQDFAGTRYDMLVSLYRGLTPLEGVGKWCECATPSEGVKRWRCSGNCSKHYEGRKSTEYGPLTPSEGVGKWCESTTPLEGVRKEWCEGRGKVTVKSNFRLHLLDGNPKQGRRERTLRQVGI